MSLSVYYDGDCPFCSRYVSLLRLKDNVGPVDLVNLRDHPEQKDAFIAKGYNLDSGMLVDWNGRISFGDEAVNQLALLSTPSGAFNRFNKAVMSSPLLSGLLYPVLRSGRWLTLFLMGREPIMAERPGAMARSEIFALLFSLFSIFHFFSYALDYGRFPPQWDQFLLLVSAIALFFRPKSPRLLFLLMLTSTISAVAQAPVASNHTIVRNFAVLGYWISFAWAMIRGRRWSDIFTNFSMAGQGVLLVMYFFGVFHKINTGFLNPETSCTTTLWSLMPPPLSMVQTDAMLYVGIYGTLIIESALALMLLTKRFRHIAIACGMAFHLLLALSNYSIYITFTTLSISLHCLFLNEEAALKVQNAPLMKAIVARRKNPLYLFAGVALLVAVFGAGLTGQYTLVTLLMLPVMLPLCYVIIRHGGSDKDLIPDSHKVPARLIGGLITALFFANCWMPYLGLKTAQSVNMFANLRLEAGVSNHLIMRDAPGPFKYLEDVAVVTEITGGHNLLLVTDGTHAAVFYDVLAFAADNPEARISYVRNGVTYTDMNANTLAAEIEETLHPRWFRKWFHFQPVNLDVPEPCYF